LRVTGRRPGEVTLVIRGGFDATDRRAVLTGVDGLRAIGYLIAFGDFGTAGVPLDLIADAAPYVLVLSPDLIDRIPHDHRRSGLVEALGATARGVGAHLVAPAVREEAQFAALRRWGGTARPGAAARPARLASHARQAARAAAAARGAARRRSRAAGAGVPRARGDPPRGGDRRGGGRRPRHRAVDHRGGARRRVPAAPRDREPRPL